MEKLSYFNGYRINPKLIMESYKRYDQSLLIAETADKITIS